MSFPAHKFNEMVLQLLFSLDMGNCLEADIIPFIMRELSMTRKMAKEAYLKAQSVFEEREIFDAKISIASKEYAFDRIGRVERNVIRLALYELRARPTEPRAVIISEALRLTRKFSTKEAAAYVNALLDSVETETNNSEQSTLSPPKPDPTE